MEGFYSFPLKSKKVVSAIEGTSVCVINMRPYLKNFLNQKTKENEIKVSELSLFELDNNKIKKINPKIIIVDSSDDVEGSIDAGVEATVLKKLKTLEVCKSIPVLIVSPSCDEMLIAHSIQSGADASIPYFRLEELFIPVLLILMKVQWLYEEIQQLSNNADQKKAA